MPGLKERVMTAGTAPGQAWTTPGGPAEPGSARQPGFPDRVVRYGIWLAVVARVLGDRRFIAKVITRVFGAYALASLLKNNQLRPVRRVAHWYNVKGEVHGMKVLHRARRAVEPGNR